MSKFTYRLEVLLFLSRGSEFYYLLQKGLSLESSRASSCLSPSQSDFTQKEEMFLEGCCGKAWFSQSQGWRLSAGIPLTPT